MTRVLDIDMSEAKRALTLAAAALMATATMALGQQTERLTLLRAIDLARENNPTFLATQNDEAAFDWAMREAVSNLLIPQVSAFGQARYRAPGVSRTGTITTGGVDQGAQYTSFYRLAATYTLDGNTLFGVPSAKADRSAAHARTVAAEFTLESLVTLQYMTALRARDQVEVARRQVDRSIENFEIAQARVDAQAAIVTDAKQAQVQLGRDSVALLQFESALRVETFRLLENIGFNLEDEVELVSEFGVFEPTWTNTALISRALESHPQLQAFAASEGARKANLRQARGSYFPSMTLTGAWDGFTQEIQNGQFLVQNAERGALGSIANCEMFNGISSGLSAPLSGFPRDCTAFTITDASREAILASNQSFPFNFTQQPFSAQLNVSIPLFNGFSRERQVSQAANAYEDAVHFRRAEELRLRTAVTSAHDALATAYNIVQVEERNRVVAAEQLELARARYTLGADNFLVLLDAERITADAERGYLDALYTFHIELANLENAVGQRLRPEAESN